MEPLLLVGVIAFGALCFGVWRALRSAERASARLIPMGQQMAHIKDVLAQMSATQLQLSGALGHVSQSQISGQTQMLRAVEERMEDVALQLGDRLGHVSEKTAHSFGALQQRLDGIDQAQNTLEQLSAEFLSLQDILANKQARGQFGEIQLSDILSQFLPKQNIRLQPTLPNGRRPDALIILPDPPGEIAIDAKFPLEGFRALLAAKREADPQRLAAAKRAFRRDTLKHIQDIADRYILPGSTADSALMFVPSEAVFAELHAEFEAVVRAAFERRVWIVSPTTLSATLSTMRGILKDHEVRASAAEIRRELSALGEDLGRLDARTQSLTRRFAQAEEDLRGIGVSAQKAARRGMRLEALDFDEDGFVAAPVHERVASAGNAG